MVPRPPEPTSPLRHGVVTVLVGLPPVLLTLVLLTGSLQSAGQLLFFSVICTLGIGAAFWVGLAYLCGRILLYLLRQIRGGPDALAGERHRRHVAAVATYIDRRRHGGGDPGLIRRDLRQAGWPTAEIEEAFAGLERR